MLSTKRAKKDLVIPKYLSLPVPALAVKRRSPFRLALNGFVETYAQWQFLHRSVIRSVFDLRVYLFNIRLKTPD